MERLKAALQDSDAVVIGAGSGLSTAAGFIYTGERFETYFSDFARKYGFRDMYSGGFYPFDMLEEYWAYWSRYIYINRYQDAPKPVYEDLLSWYRTKIILSSPRMLTIAFRRLALTKAAFLHAGRLRPVPVQ